MKKFTLFTLAFLCFGALFGQGRFSVSFQAGGGYTGAEIPGYEFLHPGIGSSSTTLEAGYRFLGKLHATVGGQYDSRFYHFSKEDKFSNYPDHRLSMLTVPLGLQFRLPWAYAGAGVHYSTMVSQRQETRPSYINFFTCIPLPGDMENMYTYFDRYQTWGYSVELGFTPRLFGGLHALVETKYAADLSETGFVLPRYRGFSGSVGVLYVFGENKDALLSTE
jgi:hypothetical protein